MKAMIFAAGLGTRLKPFTENCPKALVPVCGKPMLEHVIGHLKTAGFDHLIVNVHHFGQQIIDFLEKNRNFGIQIDVSDEREKLLDTGGGIKKAVSFLQGNEPFLVHNVDILTDLDLGRFYEDHLRCKASASLFVSRRDTSRYLFFDACGHLKGWENRKTGEVKSCFPDFHPQDYEAYAFGGIHVLSPDVFKLMEGWNGKFSIIDFYLAIAGKNDVKAYRQEGIKWMDIGKPEALAEAEKLEW